MKKNGMLSLIGIVVLALIVLTGCAAAAVEQEPEVIAEVAETGNQAVEMLAEVIATQPPATEPSASEAPAAKLTAEEAKAIALTHAGLTADQVTRLRVEYEVDHGVPEYEVEFHQGNLEYDYEIHAETGKILFWNKEVDD